MKISIALPAMAPQPTGHPASLPPDPVKPTGTRHVPPATAGTGSSDSRPREYASQQDQRSAPPSVIQIKIMELLEEQAEELKQMAEDGETSEDQDSPEGE